MLLRHYSFSYTEAVALGYGLQNLHAFERCQAQCTPHDAGCRLYTSFGFMLHLMPDILGIAAAENFAASIFTITGQGQ